MTDFLRQVCMYSNKPTFPSSATSFGVIFFQTTTDVTIQTCNGILNLKWPASPLLLCLVHSYGDLDTLFSSYWRMLLSFDLLCSRFPDYSFWMEIWLCILSCSFILTPLRQGRDMGNVLLVVALTDGFGSESHRSHGVHVFNYCVLLKCSYDFHGY